MREFTEDREQIKEQIIEETAEDRDTKRRSQMLRAVSLPAHAGVATNLSKILKNLIPLQRLVWKIDDDSDKPFAGLAVNLNPQGEKAVRQFIKRLALIELGQIEE